MASDGISSNHNDVKNFVPANLKSVKLVWFLIVKEVKVSGKCTTFKLPPTGKEQPLICVFSM